MKPLNIDFARPRRPAPWIILACGAVFAVALASVPYAIHKASLVQSANEEVADLQRRANDHARRAGPAPLAPSPAYHADAQRAVEEADFATAAALTALERTAVVGVTPVLVEVQADGRFVRVELEFSDYARLLGYLDELNTGEEAVRWQLQRATARATNQVNGTASLESRW